MTEQQTVIPPARPQRSMMVKNLMPRLPERGRIKIGELGEKRTSKGGSEWQLPIKLDHFKAVTMARGADGNFVIDREFHEKYGDKPTEIPIRLLYDSIELNAMTRYASYAGKSTLWCAGDGETAERISERPGQEALPQPLTVPCICHRAEPGYQGKDKCKLNLSLSFLVEGMGGVGGVWKLRSTSWNTTTGILSSMAFIRSVTGGILANIPLRLRVQPKQATNPNDQSSVLIYVVSIEYPGDIAQLQQIGHQIALERATTFMSIANIEDEARRVLSLPGPENAILPGDDPEAIQAEFYPEASDTAPIADAPPRPTRDQFQSPQAPQSTETKPDENAPPPLSEAEEAELAALIVNGDAAAIEGVEVFTAFWNDPETKPYRKELTPRLEGWAEVAKGEPEPFDIIDMVGTVTPYPNIGDALDAYRDAMAEANKSEDPAAALTTVWDNNQGFMNQLDERGQGLQSKEFSMEYGKMREAAAARSPAALILEHDDDPPRETGDDIPAGDYSDDAINEENHRRSQDDPQEPPFASRATAQAPTDASPAQTAKDGANSPTGRGRTATKRASPSEVRGNDAADRPDAANVAGAAPGAPLPSPAPAATAAPGTGDLLGGTPTEDLNIPLPRAPKASDLEFFYRQLVAMIEKAPADISRLTRIRLANDRGLSVLKTSAPALYEQAMAALFRKPGAT